MLRLPVCEDPLLQVTDPEDPENLEILVNPPSRRSTDLLWWDGLPNGLFLSTFSNAEVSSTLSDDVLRACK